MYCADYNDLIREKWLRMRERKELVWTTKQGKVIPINDMTDEHLENTIAMLEREDFEREIVLENDPFDKD